jgi:dTDP-D-glucose 4,6-dehydratase
MEHHSTTMFLNAQYRMETSVNLDEGIQKTYDWFLKTSKISNKLYYSLHC